LNNIEAVELNEDQWNEIIAEVEAEERNPKHDASAFGPRNIDKDRSPFAIFSRFFDIEVLTLLVNETNRYYEQYATSVEGIENMKPHARARAYKNVNIPEMKAFLAMLLYIGLVFLPSYDDYWSKESLIDLKSIKAIMPRDIFLDILLFIHTVDNCQGPPHESPEYNPTYKISQISALLLDRWQRYYYPNRQISVDETLIPFKGRTKLLQYIPSKPHKWGLKV
jgi:hypothetical protein